MLNGVSTPNSKAKLLEQRVAVIFVVVPFCALVGAIVVLWRSGVGPIDVAMLVGMFVANIIGIGVGLHRHFSHRAFQTTTPIRITLAVLGSMAAQGPLLFWAAVHRRHHAFSDREGDPHSPHLYGDGWVDLVRGFWHAHVGWVFMPEVHDLWVFVPDLVRDPLVLKISRLYFVWVGTGLAIPAAIGGIVTRTWAGAASGLLWGGLIRIALTHHTTWSVNSICHIYGRRPFRSRDLSANNLWLAIPSFGEAWHNNHHAFPSSAFHGLQWWEVDLSGYIIRLLEMTGLAWNVKRPSALSIREMLQTT